ncbi:hmg box transcription factor bbx [Plakobranchus ocellatus]|uniref:Hmg box transcription factor bbx n=1 Tax=Plakobranchus ocellatus TaxID=259542 RepID=A0AAV4D6D2_9GAST|nr:hmg box transcription factor bbx [Plakobranchus ocellatus]
MVISQPDCLMDPTSPDKGTVASNLTGDSQSPTHTSNLGQNPVQNGQSDKSSKFASDYVVKKDVDVDKPESDAEQLEVNEELELKLLQESSHSTPQCSSNNKNDGAAVASGTGTVRRPMNAFLIFCKRHRAMVREENPELDNRSVTRVLGELWSKLGPEKATYTNLAKQNKEAFLKANPNFKWSGERTQSGVTRPARVTESVSSKLSEQSPAASVEISTIKTNDSADHEAAGSNIIKPPGASESTKATNITGPPARVVAAAQSPENEERRHHALLQLAEMCSTELQTSEASAVTSASPKSPAALTSTKAASQQDLVMGENLYRSLGSPYNNSSHLGPLKKRAKHWGKPPEDDGSAKSCENLQRTHLCRSDISGAGEKVSDPGADHKIQDMGSVRRMDEVEHDQHINRREIHPFSSNSQNSSDFGTSYGGVKDTSGNATFSHVSSDGETHTRRDWPAWSDHRAVAEGDLNPLNLSMPRSRPIGQEHEVRSFHKSKEEHFSTSKAVSDGPPPISSFGDSYASVERYKSANHRYRKVSSSATESIPSFSPPPPLQHVHDDTGSDIPSASGTVPSGVNNRWFRKSEIDLMDRKFFASLSDQTRTATGMEKCSLVGLQALPRPGFDSHPPTSMVARMMMQPRHEDLVATSDAGYLLPPNLRASVPDVMPHRLPPSTRPDTLTKLLSADSVDRSAKSSQGGLIQNHRNPEFHQWRDPLSSNCRPQAADSPSSLSLSVTLASAAPQSAPFAVRHQFPLALPASESSVALSSPPQQLTLTSPAPSNLSLPATALRMPASGTVHTAVETLSSSSSVFMPISKPSMLSSEMNRQTGLTTVVGFRSESELRDCNVPATAPSRSQGGASYSEGKLKKKWAQRMLVEEKMEEDRNKLLLLQGERDNHNLMGAADGSIAPSKLLPLPESPASDRERKATPSTSSTALDDRLQLMTSTQLAGQVVSKENYASSVSNSSTMQPMQMQSPHRLVFPSGASVVSTTISSARASPSFYNYDKESIISKALRSTSSISQINSSSCSDKNTPLSLSNSSNIGNSLLSRPALSTTSGSSILSSCLMAKQPLAAVKSSMPSLAPPTRSFNASSHPKLMLQLSQGTTSSSALTENSSLSTPPPLPSSSLAASATQTAFQSLATSPHIVSAGRLPSSSNSNYSANMVLPSPLLPLASQNSFSPSDPSTLSVVSTSFGLSSDTLKVDLGAGGWRDKTSPTLSDEKPDKIEFWKDDATFRHSSNSSEVHRQQQMPHDAKTCQQLPPPMNPPSSEMQEPSSKVDKPSNRKGAKRSRKNGRAVASDKESPLLNEETCTGGKVPRGRRKKRNAADAEMGSVSAAGKNSSKRGQRKAAAKKGEPQLKVFESEAMQSKDLSGPAELKTQSILSEMRILNPIAACGKKIVDHIVEQLFKSSELSDSGSDASQGGNAMDNKLNAGTNNPAPFSKPGNHMPKGILPTENFVIQALIGENKQKMQTNLSEESQKKDIKLDINQHCEQRAYSEGFAQGKVKKELKTELGLFRGQVDSLWKMREDQAMKAQRGTFGDEKDLRVVKSEKESGENWSSSQSPGLGAGLAKTVKSEDSRQKIFGGNGTWMGEVHSKERQLFPACSLVERVVREVCGSPPEKRSCFSCQRKEELPSFTKATSGVTIPATSSPLPRVQAMMPGSSAVHHKGFCNTGSQPDERSTVWTSYRQNNNSPLNEDLEIKPTPDVATSARASALLGNHNQLTYQQLRATESSCAGFVVGRGVEGQAAVNMADLIKHHLEQQEEEEEEEKQRRQEAQDGEEEEEEEQLRSQPVRKSRRANRGQKYQELIKEGIIQPSRERLTKGSSSQEDSADAIVDQKKAMKRRASERDIQSTPSPLSVGGSLSRSSSVSSQVGSKKSLASFDLEKEIESLPVCSLENLGEKRRRVKGRNDSQGGHGRWTENGLHTSTLQSRNTEAAGDSDGHRGKSGRDSCVTGKSSLESGAATAEATAGEPPSNMNNLTAPAVTGSRKRKARKHCITRISVVGQQSSPERAVSEGSSNEVKPVGPSEAGDASTANTHTGCGSRDVKSSAAANCASSFSSFSSGSVLISPACKDLISGPAEKQAKPPRQVQSSGSAAAAAALGNTTQPSRSSELCHSPASLPKQVPVELEKTGTSSQDMTADSNDSTSVQHAARFGERENVRSSNFGEFYMSVDKRENFIPPPSKDLKQDIAVRHEEILEKRECLDVKANTIFPVQMEASQVLQTNNNSTTVLECDETDAKLHPVSKGESSKSKKASKLRSALLSGHTDLSKCSSSDTAMSEKKEVKTKTRSNNKAANKQNSNRLKSENDKSNNSGVKKPRKSKACAVSDEAAAAAGVRKKPKTLNPAAGLSKDGRNVTENTVPSTHTSLPLSVPCVSASVPSVASSYHQAGQHSLCSSSPASVEHRVVPPVTQGNNNNSPRPKSAILSAILASAPMVERPTLGLGGAYLSSKAPEQLTAPSAPGLRTAINPLNVSSSPKSPGQADTPETGQAVRLVQASSLSAASGQGYKSDVGPNIATPSQGLVGVKHTKKSVLGFKGMEASSGPVQSHSLMIHDTLPQMSQPPPLSSSSSSSPKSSTGLNVSSPSPTAWQQESPMSMRTAASTATTAAAATTATAQTLTLLSSRGLPVSVSTCSSAK